MCRVPVPGSGGPGRVPILRQSTGRPHSIGKESYDYSQSWLLCALVSSLTHIFIARCRGMPVLYTIACNQMYTVYYRL